MAKRTVDYSDYTPPQYEEYTGEAPPPNQWFTGEVVRAAYLEEDDQVRFIIELVDHPDYAGWGKGWYAPFEGNQKWKMQEILRAMQGGQEKPVTLDWEVEAQVKAFLKKCKRIRFQTELYNDDIKIKKVRPLLEATGAKPAAKATAPAPTPQAVETDDEPLEDYTEAELAEMSIDDLKEILAEEFEVDVPAKGRREKEDAYKEKLVDAILDAQEEGGEDQAEEAAEDGDADFDDGFTEDPEPEPEPEPEPDPTPAPRARRGRAAAQPEPEAAPVARATRRRRA